MKDVTTSLLSNITLPLVIEPNERDISPDEFLLFLQNNKQQLHDKLLQHGGLLFRNFPCDGEHDFARVVKTLGLGKFLDYIGGDSPRTKVAEGVYTSTEAPPSIKIPLHNELSFVKHYPKHIYFHCHVAPQANGETIIADARKVYLGVDEEVKRHWVKKGLKYVSCYFYESKFFDLLNKIQKGHKSWKDVFETTDKKKVEELCHKADFHFKWTRDDWIELSQFRPAVTAHHDTKEMVWFNQAHLYDFNPKLLGWWRYIGAKLVYVRKDMRLHEIFFGDDSSRIPRDQLYHVLDTLDAQTIKFPWQKGDVLVLDNVLAMHGRETYTGKRRILTSMTG